MKIGIISDTHGALGDFQTLLNRLEDADKIIHLGDVLYHGPRNDIPEGYDPRAMADLIKDDDRFYFVKGNCDSEVDQTVLEKDLNESERLIEVGDNVFYIHHGHRYSEDQMVQRAKEYGANVVIYGHTHQKVIKNMDGLLVMNPGSLSIPKDGSKSYGVYEDGLMKIYNLEDGNLWMMFEESRPYDEEEGHDCGDCGCSCGC